MARTWLEKQAIPPGIVNDSNTYSGAQMHHNVALAGTRPGNKVITLQLKDRFQALKSVL